MSAIGRENDRERVEELLGRPPRGAFDVVVRDGDGDPVVVRNAPFLDDGTPMPTRYYLVGAELVRAVSRVEAAGGVRQAEEHIDAQMIVATHNAYALDRDAAIPAGHDGPTPYGGVGGTRQGVKCLHAHVAYLLAGGDDPIGMWTLEHLIAAGAPLAGLDPPAPQPTIGPGAVTGRASRGSMPEAQPGDLAIRIDDHSVAIEMTGGGSWTMPVGPITLLDGELERADPPRPANLTNALGTIHDHFDDIIVQAPSVLAAASVVFSGRHAAGLARVELGHDQIPAEYQLLRADADEVFRTLVAEPNVERRFNPGLTEDFVESIIATLCIVLSIMRRLDLGTVSITVDETADPTSSSNHTGDNTGKETSIATGDTT